MTEPERDKLNFTTGEYATEAKLGDLERRVDSLRDTIAVLTGQVAALAKVAGRRPGPPGDDQTSPGGTIVIEAEVNSP